MRYADEERTNEIYREPTYTSTYRRQVGADYTILVHCYRIRRRCLANARKDGGRKWSMVLVKYLHEGLHGMLSNLVSA